MTQEVASGTSSPKKESPQLSPSQDGSQNVPTECATPTKSTTPTEPVMPPQGSPKESPRWERTSERAHSCSGGVPDNLESVVHSPPTSATSNGPLQLSIHKDEEPDRVERSGGLLSPVR